LIEALLSKRKRYLSLFLCANPYAGERTIVERLTFAAIAGRPRLMRRLPMEQNNSHNPRRHTIRHCQIFSLRAGATVNSSRPKSNEDDALKLSEGDRVHLSELGRSRHHRDTKKKGTIVGRTQYPNSLRIVWDGSRWPIAVHRNYLQLLNEEVSNADDRSSHGHRE
jgi:hypothetical protein